MDRDARRTGERPIAAAAASCGLCVLLLAGLPPAAAAQETLWIDRVRGGVRATTATLAGELDAFLSDREYEAGLNQTRVALRFGLDIDSDGGIDPLFEPRIRLSLPYTERLLYLDVFGLEEPRGDAALAETTPLLTEDLPGNLDAVQIRLGTTFRGLGIAPSVGLRSDDDDIRVFAGLRVSGSREIAPDVTLSGSQRLVVDSVRKVEAVTLVRADWQTSDVTVLRGQVELDWRRDRAGVLWQPSVVYRRFLNAKTVISVQNGLELYTARSETDEFVADVRLRRELRGDWLFAELKPWVSVELDEGRDTTQGLEVLLDVTF